MVRPVVAARRGDHPAHRAVARWEALRLQPGTGMAIWLRDHLDHQLPVLLGRTGPFSMCSEDEHIDPRQARTQQAPDGWWG